MKIQALFIASVFAVLASASAKAADAIVSVDPNPIVAAPSFSWSGAYVGGQVGYGWAKSTLNSGYEPLQLKPDGFLGGIYAGYNFDIGNNIILGVEGDATYNNLKDSRTQTDEMFGTSILENKLQWSGAVRARAGVAVDRFLPYIAGGVAFGNVKNSLSSSGGFFDGAASQSKTLTGWTLGAGVDYAVTNNLILRFEYRYTDFGSKDFYPSHDGFEYFLPTKIKASDIRLGVAYKF